MRRSARIGLGASLALLAALGGCGRRAPRRAASPPRREASTGPNVLLISIDTLRADRLNCYGYAGRKVSPAIDALAADGILFENQISTSPWTTPSHLSLLTSLYPSSHGVTASFADVHTSLLENRRFVRLPDVRVTLAEALAARGYRTAAFTGGITLDPRLGFEQGFSVYDTSMAKLGPEHLAKLEGWLGKPAPGPFFLFWHTFEVHAPYLRTTFLADALPEKKLRQVEADLAQRALLFAEELVPGWGVKKILKRRGVFNREVCDALYMGGVHSADHWVGELIAWLRRTGLYDRTLIVFTSDHGEELGQRSASQIYDGHGHTLYTELIRVPLIVKLPGGRRAGTRVRAVTSAVDVMPTILDAVGGGPGPGGMQGQALRPLWEHPERVPGRVVYAEALGIESEMKAIGDDRYRYILTIGPETVARFGRNHIPERPARRELYDLLLDPGERMNLLGPEQGGRYALLAERLDQGLRIHQAGASGTAESVELEPETIQKLKALGYVQ